MEETRHIVTQRDMTTLTGVCRVCGPVSLLRVGANRRDPSKSEYGCANKVAARREFKQRKRTHKKAFYGLTDEQALALSPDGVCVLCQKNPAQVVDHDHGCCPERMTCGDCVRGLVCRRCNSMLGWLETGVGVEKVLAYLGLTSVKGRP